MISSSYEAHLVSVIIPTFNRASLITEAIESVFKQTYRPIECIVIDDGSTDNTKTIIEQLQHELNSNAYQINYIFQSNAGAPSARNRGIAHSEGDYIQFLDSDDLLYPDKIMNQIVIMEDNPNVDGVYGDWHHGTAKDYELIKGEKWEDTISQFYGGRVIHTLSFLFRRRIIDKIGLWDENLKRNQEVDFHLRGVLVGGNFDYLPTVTGLWREHEGERIVSSNGALYALEFHEKWIREFNSMGLLTEDRKKTAAQYLFWYALELDTTMKWKALYYLKKAIRLYPYIPEFNTKKMKILRKLFGINVSVRIWNYYRNLRKSNC